MTTTHPSHPNLQTPKLYMALELSKNHWQLGFATSIAQNARRNTIDGGSLVQLDHQIALAKKRIRLPENAPIASCYEAGPDGFWLHRVLAERSVHNLVVDSSSIQVDRRQRRAKTDRLDVGKLLRMLIRHDSGEAGVWRTVNVPSPADEDARQLHRELMQLKRERTSRLNRLGGLLLSEGQRLVVDWQFAQRLQHARRWDGTALGADLVSRLLREFRRLQEVEEDIRHLEKERVRRIRDDNESTAIEMVRTLLELRGVGLGGAWLLTMELFAWRKIRNRRELAALVGLTGTPYQSGDSARDQGISKAGNRRVREMMVELAWLWKQYQPQSALSQWYARRFADGHPEGTRGVRKTGIVALSRKLLIAFWKCLDHGEIPQGAIVVEWKPKLQAVHYSPSLLTPVCYRKTEKSSGKNPSSPQLQWRRSA